MVLSSTQTSPLIRGGDPFDVQPKYRRDVAFGRPSPANTGVAPGWAAWVLYLLSGVAS
jgi:hypothetical protein